MVGNGRAAYDGDAKASPVSKLQRGACPPSGGMKLWSNDDDAAIELSSCLSIPAVGDVLVVKLDSADEITSAPALVDSLCLNLPYRDDESM